MEFEVESKFEGKTLPQVTSLIVNQVIYPHYLAQLLINVVK